MVSWAIETTGTEQVVRNKINLLTFFYETETGVIACGDSGDIFSLFTSGRYDHRLLKQHIWKDY